MNNLTPEAFGEVLTINPGAVDYTASELLEHLAQIDPRSLPISDRLVHREVTKIPDRPELILRLCQLGIDGIPPTFGSLPDHIDAHQQELRHLETIGERLGTVSVPPHTLFVVESDPRARNRAAMIYIAAPRLPGPNLQEALRTQTAADCALLLALADTCLQYYEDDRPHTAWLFGDFHYPDQFNRGLQRYDLKPRLSYEYDGVIEGLYLMAHWLRDISDPGRNKFWGEIIDRAKAQVEILKQQRSVS